MKQLNILIYTNCQGKFIFDNFLKNLDYFKNYNVSYILNYCQNTLTENEIVSFMNCDIIIYQPVSTKYEEKNTINETDGVLKYLKSNTIKICFPSLYIDMWCLYEEGGLYVGGETILKYNNMNLDEILLLYDTNKYEFELNKRFTNCIQHMKNNEDKMCNIKITDFILNNYKNIRLFNTQCHPNGIIGCHIAKQICKCLNIPIDIDEFDYKNLTIDDSSWLYDQYAYNELKLKFNDDLIVAKKYYRNLIINIYNNPHLIKYKYKNNLI